MSPLPPDNRANSAAADELHVVLIDDHVAVTKALEVFLRDFAVRTVGVAGTLADGLELIRRRRPHVAVLDIRLGAEPALELARTLVAEQLDTSLLLYTAETADHVLDGALSCGFQGVVLKTSPLEELAKAVVHVGRGGSWIDGRLKDLPGSERRVAERTLTAREREILGELARGRTGEQIARELGLSGETVRSHIRNVIRKLGAKTRVEALAIAIRRREIEL